MNFLDLLSILLVPATGVVTWIASRKSRVATESNTMLDSISRLQNTYTACLEEIQAVRQKNMELFEDNLKLQQLIQTKDVEIEELRKRQDALQKEVDNLRKRQEQIRKSMKQEACKEPAAVAL